MARKAAQRTPVDPETVAEYVLILRRADIFYDLRDPQLEMIAYICEEVTPRKGELIFEENSTSDDLYVIADGEVDIQVDPTLVQASPVEPVEAVTIATLRRGQTFGEVALVDQGVRSAAARCAMKKTRLLRISRDRLIKLCDNYTDLGYIVMRNIAADLAFKMREADLRGRERLLRRPR